MKIILLQDLKNLGKKNEVKEVAEGYAQNFLLPKKIACLATEDALEKIEAQKEKENMQKVADRKKAEELAVKLKSQRIIILAKEKEGKLFGSIGAKQISEQLKKENLNISPVSVMIEETIKKTGEYEVKINLAENVQAKIVLEVRGN